jgi:hypothetical protein
VTKFTCPHCPLKVGPLAQFITHAHACRRAKAAAEAAAAAEAKKLKAPPNPTRKPTTRGYDRVGRRKPKGFANA